MASFTNYSNDREFTNKVHNEIALDEIYDELGWEVDERIDPYDLNRFDM